MEEAEEGVGHGVGRVGRVGKANGGEEGGEREWRF